jgi:hypothetical protein
MTYHGVDVAETLDAAAARWQTLSDDDTVAKEIECYRAAAVAALAEARANGGDCASDEELELVDEEAPDADADEEDAAAAAGAAAGGDDGGAAGGADAEADGGESSAAPSLSRPRVAASPAHLLVALLRSACCV